MVAPTPDASPEVLAALRAAIDGSELHRFIERNLDGLAITYGDRIAYANPAWAAFVGCAPMELTGESILEHVHADDREGFALRLTEGTNTPEGTPREVAIHDSFRFRRTSGETLIIELLQAETFEIGGLVAKVVIGRDVTEIRRIHARMLLADRMISVGTLAAGVAHEINNPLSYIMGNLAFVQEELPTLARGVDRIPPDLSDALEEARQGAERVRQIVRDLQAFSRADHQSSPSIEVRRSIELAINMAWIEIRHRARLIKEFGDVPPVEASEARLGQVFLSLLLSAAHALPEGSADKHQLRVATKRSGDGKVLIEISHDGPALPREIAQRMFDPFVTRGAAVSGAGLGLSIAHSIVSDLSGEIEVETGPAGGTLFRVKLLPAVPKKAPAPAAGAHVTAKGRNGRVLVIDDEPLIATSIRRTLRDHEVELVDSGKKAIQLLARDRAFDLVLCDLMMPELTGMDVYDWIRAAHPGLETRVVFMTGGVFTQRASEFLASVSNERIDKPFDMEKVREFVREYIAKRRV